jgi:hypothetical protein
MISRRKILSSFAGGDSGEGWGSQFHRPIRPRQLPGCEDVPFHGLPERSGIRRHGRIHRIIQRPDGQDIAMDSAAGRAGTGILRFLGTVHPLESPARQFLSWRDTCRKSSQLARLIREYPVVVGPDRCIGIFKDQGKTPGAFQDIADMRGSYRVQRVRFDDY